MEKIETLAETLKALADPTRLRIVKLLGDCNNGICKGGPLCVNALANQLQITQSAVSQHLRILKAAGLVHGKRKGSFMHYMLNRDGIEKCSVMLGDTLGAGFLAK